MDEAIAQTFGRLSVIGVCALSTWGLRLLPTTGYLRPAYELFWLAASLGAYLWLRHEDHWLSGYARNLSLIFGLAFVFILVT